ICGRPASLVRGLTNTLTMRFGLAALAPAAAALPISRRSWAESLRLAMRQPPRFWRAIYLLAYLMQRDPCVRSRKSGGNEERRETNAIDTARSILLLGISRNVLRVSPDGARPLPRNSLRLRRRELRMRGG